MVSVGQSVRTESIDFHHYLSTDWFHMQEAVLDSVTEHAPQAPSYSLALKLKVKNLYLIQHASHAEIAKQTKLTLPAVAGLIHREGWPALKKKQAEFAEISSDTHMSETAAQVVAAVTDQCTEIALSGLNRCRDAVSAKGKDAAKNFQSWTGGVRNLVSAIKTLQAQGPGEAGGNTMNVFLIRAGDALPEKPAEPKQVTDI